MFNLHACLFDSNICPIIFLCNVETGRILGHLNFSRPVEEIGYVKADSQKWCWQERNSFSFYCYYKKNPVDLSSRRLKFCTICKLWFPSESSNKIHLFLFLRSKLTTVTGFYKTINIVTIGPSTDFLVWFL